MPSCKKSRRASRKNSRRSLGGGKFTAFLKMRKDINKKYKDMEDEKIIEEMTKGVNTNGVRIEVDNLSSVENQYEVYFYGERDRVNQVIRDMKPNVALERFGPRQGATRRSTRSSSSSSSGSF